MTEAVHAQQIMLAAMAGALIVVFGAAHAFFLALAKLRRSRIHLRLSYAAYGAFVVMTMILAWTLHLTGFWFLVVIVMLLGYLLAPYGIWHLSVATHAGEREADHAGPEETTEGD
jgi:Ca2+/Na+ antiporter